MNIQIGKLYNRKINPFVMVEKIPLYKVTGNS